MHVLPEKLTVLNGSQLHETRAPPGKGEAIFSEQHILRGTPILAEEPILILPPSLSGHAEMARLTFRHFSALPLQAQDAILSLHECSSKQAPKILSMLEQDAGR